MEEYEVLVAVAGGPDEEAIRRRLESVSYTLCVATGTREIEDALATARSHVLDTGSRDDSVVATDHVDPGATDPGAAEPG
jgi:hypothetical protein